MKAAKLLKDTDHPIKKLNKPTSFQLARTTRWFIFFELLSLSFIINIDSGVISGATSDMKAYYNIDNSQLGTFGSVSFIGNTLGSLLSISIINKYSRKNIIVFSTLINAWCLYLWTQRKSFYLILVFKTISSFCASYHAIYSPVWCDQYGIKSKRTLKIALFHMISPAGYICGYALSVLTSWITALNIQVCLLIINAVIILWFCDRKFFSRSIMVQKTIQDIEMSSTDDWTKSTESDNNTIKDEQVEGSSRSICDNSSVFEYIENVESKDFSRESVLQQICIVWKSPVFVFMSLALCAIYFVVAGIQFWANDYLETVLLITDKSTRFYWFTSICATSPILGIIFGGVITTFVGGYDKKHSIYIPILASLFVTISANFVTISLNKYYFGASWWIYLFFGSWTLPAMTGIILSSVPKSYSGSASAISICIYNIIGKFPAPTFYGAMKEKFKETRPMLPMTLLVNFAVFGLLFMLISLKYHNDKYKEVNEDSVIELSTEKNSVQKNKSNREINENSDIEQVLIE